MTSVSRLNFSKWLFHVIVWAILLALPFFSILPGRPIMDAKAYLHYAVMILSFMSVFYTNWFWLIRKYLSERRIGMFILLNLSVIGVVMFLMHIVYRFLLPSPSPSPEAVLTRTWLDFVRFLLGNIILYTMVVVVAVAVKMTGQWYEAESLRKDLENKRTEAELQGLKSQLNPHFLFNTLNNIYSLIQIDGDRAQAAVHDLGEMLRYVLYDSSDAEVPLRKELDFLKDYIALMQLRLPRHVRLNVSLPEDVSSREIAPMLFISPVENAFKHGVSNNEDSFISILIREEEDKVVCEIRNSSSPKAEGDRSGSGIGIRNLEQRLDLIYPGRYVFSCGESEGIYESHMEIPL